jgi:hypothetical protein
MSTTISGLPAHILLVHFVVVLIPAAAALVIVAAVWPAARRWLNWLPPLAALGALIAVPITTNAGHWLLTHLNGDVTPAIRHHQALGNQLLPWAIALFAASLVVWGISVAESGASLAIGRREGAPRGRLIAHASSRVAGSPSPTVSRASARRSGVGVRAFKFGVAILAILAALGVTQQVYRTGEAGSRIVWSGTFHN